MRSELDRAFDEDDTTTEDIANLMKKAFTPDQIQHFLEVVTANYKNGECPICGLPDKPVNAQGEFIGFGNEGNADHFEEQHWEECLVALLQQSKEQA